MLQLINDILDAAKMKHGGLVVKHERVDLSQLVADVIDMSQALVANPVQLINQVQQLPTIVADGDRVTQVMFNLVANAGKCG